MLFVGVSSSFPLRVLCLALFVRFQHFPQYVPVRKLPMLSVSSIATRSKSVTTKLVVLDDVHLVQEIFVLDFCTLPRAVGTHASTMAAAPLRTSEGVSADCLCRLQHLLARVTSASREARMPPDPPDRLCSFPLALLSSFDIEHPLPHAVPNLTASEMHACGMRHAPRLSTISFNKSFSTSAEREEVSLCTCTPVVLGKGAMSSVVQVLLFLFRQWRFPPRPMSSHRATPFRLSRRMGGGDPFFFSFVGHANLAVVAKRSTLGQEKTTNNGHSQIACASRLNRVNGFRLFNIRKW